MASEDEVVTATDNKTTPTGVTAAEVVENTKAWARIARTFAFVEIASLVLMFSCIAVWTKNDSWLAYALSVSVISLAACLILQTGEFVKPGLLEKCEKPASFFLFVWWSIGTGIITFKGPFLVTSNGWFSAWAGLLFTMHWALNLDVTGFTNLEKGRQYIALLGLCAFIEVFACIDPIRAGIYRSQAAWGLTAGVITLLTCGTIFKMYDNVNIMLMKITAAVMFVIWTVVAGVCTFDGPFHFTGNGYFASWGGLVVSLLLGLHQMKREDEIV